MKDFYPQYIKSKQKLTRLEKVYEQHKKKCRKEIREYQLLIHKMRHEIQFLKGYKPDKIHGIYERILDQFGITENEIKSPLRDRPIVNIRHALFYYMRYRKNMNTIQIGAMFNRDHSSVINGCRKVENWLDMPQFYSHELQILKTIDGADDEEGA